MAQDNPTALGRFRPEVISGVSTDERKVHLKTNLAGQPIRFSFSEDINSIVSTATLTMLNASLTELNQIQQGVLSGNEITEEDEALWGTLYQGATVEPNQLVVVYEILGDYYEANDPALTDLFSYSSIGDGEICKTFWRVVSLVSYTNKDGIPYCDIQLESLSAIALESKVDPKAMGSKENQYMVIEKAFYNDVVAANAARATVDGYQHVEDAQAILSQTGMKLVDRPVDWLEPFFAKILADGFDYGEDMAEPTITYVPCYKTYSYGDSCWQAIDDIASFNKLVMRFKRNKSLVYWTTDDEGFGDFIDVGVFDEGMKITYSKQGVYNYAEITGYVGKIDPVTGRWIPFEQKERTVEAFCPFSNNILNGVEVRQKLSVSADYLLQNTDSLVNWGRREMYKIALSARGLSVDSSNFPLSIEAGNKIVGRSSLARKVELLIISINRTTDAQQNTITSNIAGKVLNFPQPEFKIATDWVVEGAERDIGWV